MGKRMIKSRAMLKSPAGGLGPGDAGLRGRGEGGSSLHHARNVFIHRADTTRLTSFARAAAAALVFVGAVGGLGALKVHFPHRAGPSHVFVGGGGKTPPPFGGGGGGQFRFFSGTGPMSL